MEEEREEFRRYLDRSGVIHSLTQAFLKLYQTTEKPENAVPFICSEMSGGTMQGGDGGELFRAQNRINELECELSAIRRGDEIPKARSSQSSHQNHQGSDIAGSYDVSDEPRAAVVNEPRLSVKNHHSEAIHHTSRFIEPPTDLCKRSHSQYLDDDVPNSHNPKAESYTCEKEMLMSYENILNDTNCHSLLKKHLTKEMLDELKDLTTVSYQSTLIDCIQGGLQITFDAVGIFAADAECYTTFAKIFDPIISDIFPEFSVDSPHPAADWGEPNALENPDIDENFISTVRISVFRNLYSFPFPAKMTEDNYVNVKNNIKRIVELSSFNVKDLAGSFYSLESMDSETYKQLTDEQLIFDYGSPAAQIAGTSKFWPKGRGVYVNEDRNFVVWVNHEEHLKCTSIQRGGLLHAYRRVVNAAKLFENQLKFAHHPRFGFATFNPMHLGNGLRISVGINVEKLAYHEEKIKEIISKHHLQLGDRELFEEKTVFTVEYEKGLGMTEFQAMKRILSCVSELISMEKSL